MPNGEEPASSINIPGTTGGSSTRGDPIPREEHFTAEDWAVMTAVERCPVWRALKTFNLRQREKLLAAMCLVAQESMERNEERTTVHGLEAFCDWGRRWGQDEPATQLILQHQWDNWLRHVMGITAAMEVWEPSTASSSGDTANVVDQPQLNASEGLQTTGDTDGPTCGGEVHPQGTRNTCGVETLQNRMETAADRHNEGEEDQADHDE